ncbi:MAG: HD domain-containing protein [Candidatus Kariarchaeaceae archaeon]|jgi:(p)ppGpp synthase/HD superfamily hydrolase
MLDVIDRAMVFACIAHDKTYRKNNKELPYIYHPSMLAFYLMKYDYPEDVIAAALLHDTVEDTNIRIEQIQDQFGEQIFKMVSACTEDKTKSWEERKQHQIDAIQTLPENILAIKCADKLNNITNTFVDYKKSGDKIWERFNRGKDKQKWYYIGLMNAFQKREDFNRHPLFTEFKSIVDALFS